MVCNVSCFLTTVAGGFPCNFAQPEYCGYRDLDGGLHNWQVATTPSLDSQTGQKFKYYAGLNKGLVLQNSDGFIDNVILSTCSLA